MDHRDHVALLRDGIVRTEAPVWADLGSGRGAFTLALAELLGPGGVIWSVDRDGGALREQEREMRARFPDVEVRYRQADFTKAPDLPPLDGIVMANSLHFLRDKTAVVRQCYDWLKPGGVLLLVEYGADRGNLWVPHPLSFGTWARLAASYGFTGTRLLGSRPSRFLNEIYAAASVRPAEKSSRAGSGAED